MLELLRRAGTVSELSPLVHELAPHMERDALVISLSRAVHLPLVSVRGGRGGAHGGMHVLRLHA